MRAILIKNIKLEKDSKISVEGDSAHHLNVVRAKVNEEILILNGIGSKAKAKVIAVGKKIVDLHIINVEYFEKKSEMILFLGVPKKDAFEDILKNAIECGFTKIIPMNTKFSQYEVQQNERIEKIIESALIQSNNTYAPNIHEQINIKDIDKFDFNAHLSILMSVRKTNHKELKLSEKSSVAIFIGPEGGFSAEEEDFILNSKFNVCTAQMPCPILRAPTAVAVSAGYVFSLRNNLLKQ